MIDGWQDGHPPDHYLPHVDPATGRRTDCARWSVGLLGATTPAIDLDVRESGVVKLLIRLAEDMLEPGPSPLRVGQFPKALLPFSTDTPFDKIVTRWFALPGEDFTVAGFRGHRVEVLGRGQQFVGYAVHPGTGRPYKWARGSLLTYHAVDLAPIDAAAATAFAEAADDLMIVAGMLPLRLAQGRYRLDTGRRRHYHRHHAAGPGAPETVPAWQFMTPGEIARRLDPDTAHPAGNNGRWRLRCPVHHGESRDSLVIGTDQTLVWHCHAGCPQSDLARAIAEIVQ